jgi:NET1-associated nuclear protein 1 (U3 small nucleolar RNA-associated protein 17)
LRTVSIVNDTAALSIARPLEEMQLSAPSDEGADQVDDNMQLDNGEEASDGENEDDQGDTMDIDEDQGAHAIVLGQHQLSEIFDVAPAFAMPPIEDMFYKVAGLIASRTETK